MCSWLIVWLPVDWAPITYAPHYLELLICLCMYKLYNTPIHNIGICKYASKTCTCTKLFYSSSLFTRFLPLGYSFIYAHSFNCFVSIFVFVDVCVCFLSFLFTILGFPFSLNCTFAIFFVLKRQHYFCCCRGQSKSAVE